MINEYGEIRLQQLTLSKSLEHLKEPLHNMLQSLEDHGHRLPSLLYINNIKAELSFFERAVPSLQRGVHHVPSPSISGLPAAATLDGYQTHFVPSDEVNEACSKIVNWLNRLRDDAGDQNLNIVCGFDIEWPPPEGRGQSPGKVALIQFAFEKTTYVVQVSLRSVSSFSVGTDAC